MTLYNWGESPLGEWTLEVKAAASKNATAAKGNGTLDHFAITFYGFKKNETTPRERRHVAASSAKQTRAFVPSKEEVAEIYETEMKLSRTTRIVSKRLMSLEPELRSILRELE